MSMNKYIKVYCVHKLKHKDILYNILYLFPSCIKYIQYFSVLILCLLKHFFNLKRSVLKSELRELQYISGITLLGNHSSSLKNVCSSRVPPFAHL